LLLVLIGNLAFTLASLVLGIRLGLLARRTRQLPELLLAIGFFFGGFLGHTLSWCIYMLKPPEPYLTALHYLLSASAAIACALLAIMAWRVFRPDAAWAKALSLVIVAFLTINVFQQAFIGRPPIEVYVRNPLYWTSTLALMAPYFWLTWESARYQAQLRRRARIGLPADMVVATRMLLWAVGMGSIAGMLVSLHTLRVVGVILGTRLSPGPLVSIFGLICATALWLAFFLPHSWVQRIQARSAAA
jgi:hypothetical protein